jgi:hypothetical protein
MPRRAAQMGQRMKFLLRVRRLRSETRYDTGVVGHDHAVGGLSSAAQKSNTQTSREWPAGRLRAPDRTAYGPTCTMGATEGTPLLFTMNNM